MRALGKLDRRQGWGEAGDRGRVRASVSEQGDTRPRAPPRGQEDPWRRDGNPPTPVFLPGQSHGQRSLAGYSPQGHTESDTTERRNTWNRWMDVKMNRARAGRGRIRGLGSPEERCLGQSRWLPRGADAQLSLERQTNSTQQGAGRVFQAGDQHEPRPETVSTRPREGHEAALGPRMFTGGSPDGGAVRRRGTASCQPWRSWGAPTWASSVGPAPNKHSSLWKGTSSPLKCETKM